LKITKISYIRQEILNEKTEYFILDYENKVIEVYNQTLEKPQLVEFEDFEIDSVVEHFLTLTFPWKSHYENLNILDGFEWRVSIESKLHGRREYTGKNEVPDNFYQISEIIEELSSVEEKIWLRFMIQKK